MARRQLGAAALAVCVLLAPALAAAGTTGPAVGGRRMLERPQQRRQLHQFVNGVTAFFDTPTVAGSTTGTGNLRGQVDPDGTFRVSGGAGATQSLAVANPIIAALTNGGVENRPVATTSSYTQVPAITGPLNTIEPAVGYGIANGIGDILSTANGGFGVFGFGYNPLGNNLGFSAAAGLNNALNPLATDGGPAYLGGGGGASTVEMIGAAREQVDAATARVAQNAQGLIGPSPTLPVTCSQVLTYGITLANYDLGGPAGPLPSNDPINLVPFCLQFFNFGTLDDFRVFLDGFNGGGLDYEDGDYDPNAGIGGDAVYAGVNGDVPGVASDGPIAPPTVRAASPASGPAAGPRASGGASDGQGRARGAGAPRRAAGAKQDSPTEGIPLNGPGRSRSEILAERLTTQGGPAAEAFLQSPVGKELLMRADTGLVGRFTDGVAQVGANAIADAYKVFGRPVADVRAALNNATQAVATNATNAALKGAVTAINATAPLVAVRAEFNKNLVQPIAALGDELATQSAKLVDSTPLLTPQERSSVQGLLNKIGQMGQPPAVRAQQGA